MGADRRCIRARRPTLLHASVARELLALLQGLDVCQVLESS